VSQRLTALQAAEPREREESIVAMRREPPARRWPSLERLG